MFDKIKDSIQKFSGRSVADEEAVEQLVKDIQRDLIKADVDVSLVSDLSDEIREEALADDLPSGLTRKEHVLEIVYSKLEELLGEEAEVEIEPKNILLCGLYGAGKCVSPDTKIQISDGRLIKAEKLYNENSSPNRVEKLQDGERFKVDDLKVPSFNPETLEIEEKPVKYLWKLEKEEDLVKVNRDNGDNHQIEVTPEHPFFTIKNGEVIKKRADELSCSDYVAAPRKIDVGGDKCLEDVFVDALESSYNIKDHKVAKKAKNQLKKKYGSLQNAYQELDLDIKYAWLTRLLSHKSEVPIDVVRELNLIRFESSPKVVHRNSNTTEIDIPQNTEEFLEFLGYLIADGYINESYLEFNNADAELMDRWQELCSDLFGIEPIRKQSQRSEGLEYSRLNSKPLVKIICNILETSPGAKSGKISLSEDILEFKSEDFDQFLRAYFDSDGHAEKGRFIEITTKSKRMSSQLRSLFLRKKIFSSTSLKQTGDKQYHKVALSGSNATKFAEKIGSRIPRKQERLRKYREIENYQGSGSNENIPVGEELQKQRLISNTSISSIQQQVNSYGNYEKKGLICRKPLKKTLNVLEEDSKQEKLLKKAEGKTRDYIIKETGLNHSQFSGIIGGLKKEGKIAKNDDGTYEVNEEPDPNLEKLRKLSESDVNWIKVSKIERTSNCKYVYDLTVEDNHSFIANQTVIHNTTSAGKLADFYRKRGLKPALICADTDRPAAYDQLKQLAEQIDVEFYGEKDAEDPVKVVENGIEATDAEVTIVDSAGRNSLNDDLQQELADIDSVFNPDEKFLVIPADIGQSARKQAESFEDAIGLNGVIVTKMDSSAKGGGALVACSNSKASVKFIGTGEEVGDLEVYDPVDFVSDMIGQPDLESLLEKIEELDTDPEEMLEGDFTLHDFKSQIESVTGSGMMEEMMEQLPFGGNKMPDNLADITEEKVSRYSIVMDSMTDEELNDPSIINRSRKERIAEGSATSEKQVNELIKHFRQTKNMVDKFDKGSMKRGGMQDMMKKMGL